MKHYSRLFWLLTIFLVTSCVGVTESSTRVSVIVLAPDDSSSVTSESLEVTREILQTRLIRSGVEAIVKTDGNNLRVELANSEDLSYATQLVTRMGVLTFFDSTVSLPAGSPMPKDAKVILTDEDIAMVSQTFGPEADDHSITIEFTSLGRQKLAEYTQANIDHFLVIALDGDVISSPLIQSVIPDGHANIAGGFDSNCAKSLAIQLNNERLPFELVVVEAD